MTTSDAIRDIQARDALIAEALAFFHQMSRDFTHFAGVAQNVAQNDPHAADQVHMLFLRKAEIYAVGVEALEYLQAARE
jgi:hypothetical protein